MESYREDYWKLAEIEDRFNQLQGALRTLASTWTLAAFAGLAVLSQVAEKTTWLAPPALLAWLISFLSVFGLALLWVMDQFVYQRLLGAAFMSGLLLEQRHADLPAIRSLMLAGSSGGMSKYLKLFYFAPMAVFFGLGLVAVLTDVAGALSSEKAIPVELRLLLLLGSAVTVSVLLVLYRLSSKVGARALARSLGLDSLTDAVQHDRLLRTIRASHQTQDSPTSVTTREPGEAAQPRAAADVSRNHMDLWTRYLFESHPEETLRSWAKRLHLFRFFRAHGGHANDADSLDVAFRYASPEELEAFFSFLGMGLVRFSERPQQPEPGVSYPGTEYGKFPSLINGTRWIQQPGHREVAGKKVFIWCEAGKITLSVGLNYEVTEEDVQSAEAIEKVISSCPLERIDPPRDTRNYICPKYYPAYFG